MIATLAAAVPWEAPTIDYHAIAPEIILALGIVVVLLVDLFTSEANKWIIAPLSGFVLLGAIVPVVTLGLHDDGVRSLFDGRYVVDDFSLVMKGLFLLAGYVVVLLSTDYLREGDYHEGEYWFLALTSLLGMVMMSSSRDLVSVFVALEFLSIPAYMMAAWRKRDTASNEAGVKYFLLGVFASAVMLYGMSLLYGVANSTLLTDIARIDSVDAVTALAIVFVVVGFAFKISAVPFHSWAPDVYEGAPTPVTAFLSVASKAAGFVAMVTVVSVAFPFGGDVWQPMFWILAVLSMSVGNFLALRQSNIVRMLAYSSISQGGFILMPLAVAAEPGADGALRAVVTYLCVYAATNLGVFAVIIAVARKTRSGEISSYGGLFSYAPGLAVVMTLLLASLAGIPPLGGWIGKFAAFEALLSSGSNWGYALAVVAAVNSMIAFGYYGNVLREMWMRPVPDGDTTAIVVPSAVGVALVLTTVSTIVFGVLPQSVLRFGDLAVFAFVPGG